MGVSQMDTKQDLESTIAGVMDRSTANRAIAKVFAYLACGKRQEARIWARSLIEWLESI